MSQLLIASLLVVTFATGFTCSKNAPQQAAPGATAPIQADMAVPPVEAAAAVSTDATPAAAPTEPKY